MEDLQRYIGKHPEDFHQSPEGWKAASIWVLSLRVIRPESVFFQDADNFHVDILADAQIRFEDVRVRDPAQKNRIVFSMQLRLRYCFDLRPCKLDCCFSGVVLFEEDSLRALDKTGITLDKYLLPYLSGDQYEKMAQFLLHRYNLESSEKDVPFDPEAWISAMGVKLEQGAFPENGVLGEYFFSYGSGLIVDPETGNVIDADIDPATILINSSIEPGGVRNTTLTHEGIHHYLGRWFFMLQRTHGHQYCSYMCKRRSKEQDDQTTWTPVEIMELQANKLPGYLAIPEKYGKARALKLLESYGGQRNLANISRLIDDMASYYHTTKTVARTRLLDFGFSEVKCVRQSANGDLVPAYLSTLGKNETYTIDEAQALQEYLENEQFRMVLDSGRFVYLEGHYCLNHRRYIAEDHLGYLHLTSYAREHMSDCCLVFRLTYQGALARIVNGVLQKGGGRGRKQLTFVRYDGSPATTEEGLALRVQIEKEMAQSSEILTNFNQMTKLLMKQYRMTISNLAEDSGLSEETIKSMRNDPGRAFPIQEILAVCFAMHLPYEVSEEYLRLAPSKMLNTVDMRIYRFGLINWYQLPLRTVNRRFVEAGAQPLTNDVEGFDKNGRMLKNR